MAETNDLELKLIDQKDTSADVVQKLNENFQKIDRHNHTEDTNDVRASGFIVDATIDMRQHSVLKTQLLGLVDLQGKISDPNFIIPPNSVYTKKKQIIFKDIDGLEIVIGNTAGSTGVVYDDTELRRLISVLADRISALEAGETGITEVASDSTLTGDGSEANPLKVAIPLTQEEKDKIDALSATDLPVGARSSVEYSPSVIFHDPNRSGGNHGVALSTVIEQIEANNTLYTQRQTGSFVSAANFNPLTVETVSYGSISAKALVVTYNGNIFQEQQLIKVELIDSTGELTKEYLFPPVTIQNGFDYVISDALGNSSIHKKEVRVRIAYDSRTNKTKIFIHQRPVSDPPPAVYLFIIALYKVESLSQKGEDGVDGDNLYKGFFNRNTIYKQNEIFDIQGSFIQITSATWQASVDSPTFADNIWRTLVTNSAHRTKVRVITLPGAIDDASRVGDNLALEFKDGRANKNISLLANLTTSTGSLIGSKITDNSVSESKLDAAARTKLNNAGTLADGSVTTTKLAPFAVTTPKIAGGAVDETKLITAVRTKLNNPEQQILDNEFVGSKLVNNTVSEAKLDTAAKAKLNASGGGASKFIGLEDTPSELVAGKWFTVDSNKNIILTDAPSGGSSGGSGGSAEYKDIFISRSQSGLVGDWDFMGSGASANLYVSETDPTPSNSSGTFRYARIAVKQSDWEKTDEVEVSVSVDPEDFTTTVRRFPKEAFTSGGTHFRNSISNGVLAYRSGSLFIELNKDERGTLSSATHRITLAPHSNSSTFSVGRIRLITNPSGGLSEIADGSITEPKLSPAVQTKLNASGSGGTATAKFKDVFINKSQSSVTSSGVWSITGSGSSILPVGDEQPTPTNPSSGNYRRINIAIKTTDWNAADEIQVSLNTSDADFYGNYFSFTRTSFGDLLGDRNFIKNGRNSSSSTYRAAQLILHTEENQLGTSSSTTHRLEIVGQSGSASFAIGRVRLITNAKTGLSEIADGSITTSKLANGAVTTVKLGGNSVTNSKISGVNGSKIADGSIAEVKLDTATKAKLNSSAATLADGSVTTR